MRAATENVNTELAQVVVGLDAADQRTLDLAMIEADGTDNKGRLGANAILGIRWRRPRHLRRLLGSRCIVTSVGPEPTPFLSLAPIS